MGEGQELLRQQPGGLGQGTAWVARGAHPAKLGCTRPCAWRASPGNSPGSWLDPQTRFCTLQQDTGQPLSQPISAVLDRQTDKRALVAPRATRGSLSQTRGWGLRQPTQGRGQPSAPLPLAVYGKHPHGQAPCPWGKEETSPQLTQWAPRSNLWVQVRPCLFPSRVTLGKF